MEPTIFSIFDLESGNSVSHFESRDQAELCLRALLNERPQDARDYVLIGYNKIGEAVLNIPGTNLLSVAE